MEDHQFWRGEKQDGGKQYSILVKEKDKYQERNAFQIGSSVWYHLLAQSVLLLKVISWSSLLSTAHGESSFVCIFFMDFCIAHQKWELLFSLPSSFWKGLSDTSLYFYLNSRELSTWEIYCSSVFIYITFSQKRTVMKSRLGLHVKMEAAQRLVLLTLSTWTEFWINELFRILKFHF